jgi:hypothetical protein
MLAPGSAAHFVEDAAQAIEKNMISKAAGSAVNSIERIAAETADNGIRSALSSSIKFTHDTSTSVVQTAVQNRGTELVKEAAKLKAKAAINGHIVVGKKVGTLVRSNSDSALKAKLNAVSSSSGKLHSSAGELAKSAANPKSLITSTNGVASSKVGDHNTSPNVGKPQTN